MKVYNKQSNSKMRRPIVKTEIIDLMRSRQRQLIGELAELQAFARENNIPIIPHETVVYFQFLLSVLKPKKILEIGTAIGFSTSLIAECVPTATITTIERYEEMLIYARKNLKNYNNIQLIEGDAADILPKLEEKYDFIFMDSAKTQYIKFLSQLLSKLTDDGVLIIDDVFQAGDVVLERKDIPRRERNIIKALNHLFDETLDNSKLLTTLVPLGDGLLHIKKI